MAIDTAMWMTEGIMPRAGGLWDQPAAALAAARWIAGEIESWKFAEAQRNG